MAVIFNRITFIKALTLVAILISAVLLSGGGQAFAASATIDIRVNGRVPSEYGRYEPRAVLFKVEGKSNVNARKAFSISADGRVDVDIPDETAEFIIQISLPGGLTPIFSGPIKAGSNRWDIRAAELTVTSSGAVVAGKEVFLLKQDPSGVYTNLWWKVRPLEDGHFLMPLPDRPGIYVAGIKKESGEMSYSDPLAPGPATWEMTMNRAPSLSDIPDQTAPEGGRLNLPLLAFDVDNDKVSFSLGCGSPAFVKLKDWRDGTGALVALPLKGDAASYKVEVITSDGTASVSKLFTLTVGKGSSEIALAQRGPTASIGDQTSYAISSVWANDGLDKVRRDERRGTNGKAVKNSVWDGTSVRIFGARNEVVSFNLVIESGVRGASGLTVDFNSLIGAGGARISSKQVKKDGLFDYRGRNIEIFHVGYLQIKGLSRLGYDPTYDERHVPVGMRLPFKVSGGKAVSNGTFSERPGANRYYPDIAVPIEAVSGFAVKGGENQSVWVDIYIPKESKAGIYKGLLKIKGTGGVVKEVPVVLDVMDFSLPDLPTARTMVYFSEEDLNDRYIGRKWLNPTGEKKWTLWLNERVWNAHQMMAHRHRISLVDDGVAPPEKLGRWRPVLSGSLFTPANGYEGPGMGVSSGVYSIGTYGAWRRLIDPENKKAVQEFSDRWVAWFGKNFPDVEYFLYLLDEPRQADMDKVERWASWIKEGTGSGRSLKTMVTKDLVETDRSAPSVDIAFTAWGDANVWRSAIKRHEKEGKSFWAYNGTRITTGSFMIEDEGVSLRALGWNHFKHKVGRWFYWHSNQYKNTSHVAYENNVFRQAWTFGRRDPAPHIKYGDTGSNYMNGDGVLFYPGTDRRFPEDSFGIDGPIASLRLKHWRRGIQDADYLAMASKIDPAAVAAIVAGMVPRSLWEVGVANPSDPTYVYSDASWPIDPDAWEAARRKLASIIISGRQAD
ncbi:MAG: glycoside hydrolase domain-containing protein [Deltaproteobacteria bacterium]